VLLEGATKYQTQEEFTSSIRHWSRGIKLTPNNERKLTNSFENELEKRGEMYDTEMILQIKDSLSDIYNKIVSDEQS
jgi:hypothetical protein